MPKAIRQAIFIWIQHIQRMTNSKLSDPYKYAALANESIYNTSQHKNFPKSYRQLNMGRKHWTGDKKRTHMLKSLWGSVQNKTLSIHLVTCIELEMMTFGIFFQEACSPVSQRQQNILGHMVSVLIKRYIKLYAYSSIRSPGTTNPQERGREGQPRKYQLI